MFEPLFHAEISVFDQFFLQGIYVNRLKKRQKLIHRSGKHVQKTKFSKRFSKGPASNPEMSHHKSRNPEKSQLNSGIPEMCYLI